MLTASAQTPIVIAHRGASGYLPEHSLPAVTAAHIMNADYIEQDVVLSRDDIPVVLHDIHLESTTDVSDKFPDRARSDGRFYAIDFSLAELKTLQLNERVSSEGEPVFSGRFPVEVPALSIPTLEEEILLISGLNRTREHQAGWYIEFKAPQFHRQAGKDLPGAVLAVLERHGLNQAGANVILQCFDPGTLRQIHDQGLSPLTRIQLIGDPSWDDANAADFAAMLTAEGLAEIAIYAHGIGPWVNQLFEAGTSVSNGLSERAHEQGLLIHPYTLRADSLPTGLADSFEALHEAVFMTVKADGAFSDFPDITKAYLERQFPSRDAAGTMTGSQKP